MATVQASTSQVSKAVQRDGVHEPRYTEYWRRLIARCCAGDGLVVDVGANLGWFSLLSASMGCRVLAFEPVPALGALLAASAEKNNLSSRITLHRAVVSADTSPVAMHFRASDIDTSSIGGANTPSTLMNDTVVLRVPAQTLDEHLHEPPCALKVDVEGHEPAVLRGGAAALKRHPPRVVMLEYSPGVLEREAAAGHPKALDGAPSYPAMLQTLLDAGYRIYKLQERLKHLPVQASRRRLPALWEVDATTIAAEATNANAMRQAYARDGFALPSDLQPGSLRARFAYNTDLLALQQSATNEAGLLRARGKIRGGAAGTALPQARDTSVPPRGYQKRSKTWRQMTYCWWVREGCFFRQGHGLRRLGSS